MKICEKIKALFHGRQLTGEDLAARTEADSTSDQARQEAAEFGRREGGPMWWSQSPPP